MHAIHCFVIIAVFEFFQRNLPFCFKFRASLQGGRVTPGFLKYPSSRETKLSRERRNFSKKPEQLKCHAPGHSIIKHYFSAKAAFCLFMSSYQPIEVYISTSKSANNTMADLMVQAKFCRNKLLFQKKNTKKKYFTVGAQEVNLL